jgi:hypothetical protein
LQKHDVVFFYTHPRKLKNLLKPCWAAKIEKLLKIIKSNITGSLFLIMPFKQCRIEKFTQLKHLLEICQTEKIEYISLNNKDFFSSNISKKQMDTLEIEILSRVLATSFQ